MPLERSKSIGADKKRRHLPLSEDYAPTGPLKQKTPKKRKLEGEKEDAVVGSKASTKILRIGQELAAEEEHEQRASEPNPAFDFQSRSPGDAFDEEEEVWADEDEELDGPEVDPIDQDIFERFHPANTDPSMDPNNLFDPTPSKDDSQGPNLADLILAKIAEHEASNSGEQHTDKEIADVPEDAEIELPPKVVEVYTTIGKLMARNRSGTLAKPFKVLPQLPLNQIPTLISLTEPDNWSPYSCLLATRLFISGKPSVAQPFLTSILLPRVRDDIHETKKLNVHLFDAVKKALYKPACFFKGFLFPLLEDETCTLREAHIIGGALTRVSIPVLHSAAALLRLCDIAAEQFSTRKEDGGGGATNMFIRCLLDKKYALPYKVIDALVFHFLRFKSLDPSQTDTHATEDATMSNYKLTVLWHKSLLTFAQRYRNDITEDQREALLDLLVARGHPSIGSEVRRELLEGRGRGVIDPNAMAIDGVGQYEGIAGKGIFIPSAVAIGPAEGGDDTMVMG